MPAASAGNYLERLVDLRREGRPELVEGVSVAGLADGGIGEVDFGVIEPGG